MMLGCQGTMIFLPMVYEIITAPPTVSLHYPATQLRFTFQVFLLLQIDQKLLGEYV